MSVLSCCTALRAGEWSEQARGEWRCFHNRSLRRIRQISWSIIYPTTQQEAGASARHLRWLGHVLRMEQDHIPKVALRWTPPATWEAQNQLAWNCDTRAGADESDRGEAQHAAGTQCNGDRSLKPEALRPSRDEEEYKHPQ